MLPNPSRLGALARAWVAPDIDALDALEEECQCAVDTPQYAPGVAGFPGALVSDRQGFAVGTFVLSMGNSSTSEDTTRTISGQGNTAVTGNWANDPNLRLFLNQNGDYWLLLRGSRVLVGMTGGGTPAQAVSDLGTLAIRSYLAHTPSGQLQRLIRHTQSTFSESWGEGGDLETVVDYGSARTDARDVWSRPSWPLARPINPYQDSLTFFIPQTAVARSVVIELDAIAINTQSLRAGYLSRMGRQAAVAFLLERYPMVSALMQLRQMVQASRAAA